jgi:hypothetical protein
LGIKGNRKRRTRPSLHHQKAEIASGQKTTQNHTIHNGTFITAATQQLQRLPAQPYRHKQHIIRAPNDINSISIVRPSGGQEPPLRSQNPTYVPQACPPRPANNGSRPPQLPAHAPRLLAINRRPTRRSGTLLPPAHAVRVDAALPVPRVVAARASLLD